MCKGGICYCHPMYSGRFCEVRRSAEEQRHLRDPTLCPNDCTGHGTCVLHGNASRCNCDEGFEGDDCATKACPTCAPPEPQPEPQPAPAPANHSEVKNETKPAPKPEPVPEPEPEPEETGPRVVVVSDSETRISHVTSHAAAGRTDACPNDCSGRGHCFNGVCVCNVQSFGDDCSCDERCGLHQECRGGQCACAVGWAGEDCATPAPHHDAAVAATGAADAATGSAATAAAATAGGAEVDSDEPLSCEASCAKSCNLTYGQASHEREQCMKACTGMCEDSAASR